MTVHGGKWQMAEPGTGGQQCTVLGLTHWEVTQGRAGKSLSHQCQVRQSLEDPAALQRGGEGGQDGVMQTGRW